MSQFGFLPLNIALAEEPKGNGCSHINPFIFILKIFYVICKENLETSRIKISLSQ